MSKSGDLRELLRQNKMLVVPGAFECISARTIEQAGFQAAYMTGAGTAATLGFPDYGLITMTEMVANAGRMASVLSIPLIADADTGYGNELNVIRTIREYQKHGVSGVHIEDQGFPKRCGHLDNKEIISLDDYIAKIRAAVSARTDPDFLIIARTDSRAVLGLEEAVKRANASLDAGADMAFVEAPQTVEEIAAVPKLVKGPCLLNVVWKGKTPDVPLKDAEKFGYKLTILPGMLFKAVIGICDHMLEGLKRENAHPALPKDMSIREGFARVGAAEWDPFRDQFRRPN
ncbi:isocitrate lyase/PEP mutase family protein [Bradyrhizobium sp. LHD-71]|uniref:isocitrate lyase/PEP mutase family protein n=1 Tax=Bradyrhizobium sp. LHD-71 TaxID=3072141 RepID=UPI00280F367F|nr:isocitrate lyase/PEP mutase family protein [Bradyrhizobium sp. LHD-71]MDQ8729130.1 isocitrate lyase/PEP mutase family protein [Bradyrhizobium sp. LHD-71]